jgi:hypothetical protein
MKISRLQILIISAGISIFNLNAQDCQISYQSNDTISVNNLGVCVEVLFNNTSVCFKKLNEINKYAFLRYKNNNYHSYPDATFQAEVYDSLGHQLEPLDDKLYSDLPNYQDKYNLDTTRNICTYKIGIITSSYRLESFKTYKVRLLMVLEENSKSYIHSSYTFYITKMPFKIKKKWFNKKYSVSCDELNKKSNR